MKNIGEGIWVCERPFRLFGAEFGNRMTVIRLNNAGLLVHSPVAMDASLSQEVSNLGQVAYIVTPNAFHGLFVDDWMAAFPEARHFSAKGCEDGAAGSLKTLTRITVADLSPTLEAVPVEGIPRLNEFAFFHKASRTLILTDLAFNMDKGATFWTRLFFFMNGAYGKFGPSRLMRSMIENRVALKASLLKILEWDFDRIVVSHGSIVEEGGKEVMRSAFKEYLSDPSTRLRRFAFRNPARCG